MTSLVVLTDVEAAFVGGGAITQTISVSVLQQDISTVSSTAIATNAGHLSATVVGTRIIATTIGAQSGKAAVLLAANMAKVLNSLRLGLLLIRP
jgi:hypothetical protein